VLGRIGLDVICVDADPQANLSDYFDADPDADPTLGEVLAGRARAVDAIHGELIPANLGLAQAELVLAGKIGRELTLRNALRDLKRQHDLILIDCPPTLGLLTVNSLVAATHAILSTEAQYFSLQGMEQAMEVLELARDNLNPELELLGVVLNIVDMGSDHARNSVQTLRDRFGQRLFRTVIHESVAYQESAEQALPILSYKPSVGVDYVDLAAEVLDRLGYPERRPELEALRAVALPTPKREETEVPTTRGDV